MATSKKDYEVIARIIRETASAEHQPQLWASGCNAACERIARHLADYFAANNPRFDRVRFHEASGTTGGY